MKPLIEYMVNALVKNRDSVKVIETIENGPDVYELKVSEQDLGRVIGKNGRTVHAMRTILSASAKKTGRKISIQVLD